MRISIIFLLALLVLGGCSLTKDTGDMTADEHYEYAMELFNDEDYFEAEREFRIISLKYAGTPISDDAQFYLAETYMGKEEYLVAASEYTRLIRDMPQSPYVEQASYKLAMCHYNLSPRVELDQKYTEMAIEDFELFIADFPYSEHVDEAKQYIRELRMKLARKLLYNAYIYRKLSAYDSAILYINLLLERYYDLDIVKEALYEKGMVYLDWEDWPMVRDILAKLKQVGAGELYNQLDLQYQEAYKEYLEDHEISETDG